MPAVLRMSEIKSVFLGFSFHSEMLTFIKTGESAVMRSAVLVLLSCQRAMSILDTLPSVPKKAPDINIHDLRVFLVMKSKCFPPKYPRSHFKSPPRNYCQLCSAAHGKNQSPFLACPLPCKLPGAIRKEGSDILTETADEVSSDTQQDSVLTADTLCSMDTGPSLSHQA